MLRQPKGDPSNGANRRRESRRRVSAPHRRRARAWDLAEEKLHNGACACRVGQASRTGSQADEGVLGCNRSMHSDKRRRRLLKRMRMREGRDVRRHITLQAMCSLRPGLAKVLVSADVLDTSQVVSAKRRYSDTSSDVRSEPKGYHTLFSTGPALPALARRTM
eukprot:6188407-Pleurochrysis_carterae.AAC.1